jgi:hypothetical protein
MRKCKNILLLLLHDNKTECEMKIFKNSLQIFIANNIGYFPLKEMNQFDDYSVWDLRFSRR